MLASIAEREQTRTLLRAKVRKIIQKTAFGEDINTISTLKCAFCQEKRYIKDGNSPRKQLNSIKMMNRKVLFWPLAAMLLTACEKGLVDGVADVAPADQAPAVRREKRRRWRTPDR